MQILTTTQLHTTRQENLLADDFPNSRYLFARQCIEMVMRNLMLNPLVNKRANYQSLQQL